MQSMQLAIFRGRFCYRSWAYPVDSSGDVKSSQETEAQFRKFGPLVDLVGWPISTAFVWQP